MRIGNEMAVYTWVWSLLVASVMLLVKGASLNQDTRFGNEVSDYGPRPDYDRYVGYCGKETYRQCWCSVDVCAKECTMDEQCLSFTFQTTRGFEICRMNRRLCRENDITTNPWFARGWLTYSKSLEAADVDVHANAFGYNHIYGLCINYQGQELCKDCSLLLCTEKCDDDAKCRSFVYNFQTGECRGNSEPCEYATGSPQWSTYNKIIMGQRRNN